MSDQKFGNKESLAIAFSVASIWFGTHVGGGFASGNQVISYYVQYGITAVIFPLIAMGLLAYFMFVVMRLAKARGFNNYKDTFEVLYPHPKMELIFEFYFICICLAGVASAVAGAGNVLANIMGIEYVGAAKALFNLAMVALIVVLCAFGIKVVQAASTVLSAALLITIAILVVTGVAFDYSTAAEQLMAANGIEAAAPYTSNVGSAIWRGIFVYAGFQCVSIAPMLPATGELNMKGVKRTAVLGWLMNGLALAASGLMLYKWYPLLKVLRDSGAEGFTTCLNIPNQTVLGIMGIQWLTWLFSILLFCAFLSTSVTLTYSIVQRFEPHCFPKTIKSKTLRSFLVGIVSVALCFCVSLLGLTKIVVLIYGYLGYYAIALIVLPAFIWGIPKGKKAIAEAKAAQAAKG